MGLIQFKAQFGDNFADRLVKAQEERIRLILIDQLEQVGEQFVIDVRSTETYKDRTSNLRGSHAYSITEDGKEIRGNYEGTAEGQNNARRIMLEIAGDVPKGLALIGVAGMSYAAAVEAKGYDVITGGAFIAEENLQKAMEKLQERLKKLSLKYGSKK